VRHIPAQIHKFSDKLQSPVFIGLLMSRLKSEIPALRGPQPSKPTYHKSYRLDFLRLVRDRVLPRFWKPKTGDETDRVGEKAHDARRVGKLPCRRASGHV
jgi:hypothetical protein